VEDTLKDALAFSDRVHGFVTRRLLGSARSAEGSAGDEFYFVPMALLARALRHHKAIALLVSEGYITEAAIVGLTQFELCLDMLYIAEDRVRATDWMRHASERSAPWSVKQKINAVYATDPQLREANHGAFCDLSKIKHANPLAGPRGFTMRVSSEKLTISAEPDADNFSRGWSIIMIAFCCHKILEAMGAVKKCHSEFVQFDEGFDAELGSMIAECSNRVARAVTTLGLLEEGDVNRGTVPRSKPC